MSIHSKYLSFCFSYSKTDVLVSFNICFYFKTSPNSDSPSAPLRSNS